MDYHLIRRWKPIIYVKKRLFEKGVDWKIIKELIDKHIDDINKWIWKQLKKEIQSYKEKWFDWLKIIEKLTRKGYTINQIKKLLT